MKYVRKFNEEPVAMKKKKAHLVNGITGEVIVDKEVWAPEPWSLNAVTTAVSKYFYGDKDESIGDLVHRIADHVEGLAIRQHIVNDIGYSEIRPLYMDIRDLLVNQKAAFNSPVWFNAGLYRSYGVSGSPAGFRWTNGGIVQCDDSYKYPQTAACFIFSLKDDMESIMENVKRYAMLFKYGSGVGCNMSVLRSSKELLSGGGKPSGPLSFMGIFDKVGSVVKSGGKTRRAAEMKNLDHWHPDIIEFIQSKWKEEEKAKALVAAGYSDGMDGDAYGTVSYQNMNISVRASDEFMRAAINNDTYSTTAVTTGEIIEELNAREVLMEIAEAVHKCGDPGMQFSDTINRWHTCPNSGPINSSNPCSEFLFLDDTSCNLASINLIKYLRDDNTFDLEGFRNTIETLIISQEALVDSSSYPTEAVAQNSHDFRPLGLGYCNLGGLLMALGIPYDSDEGRDLAAAITSYMTACAYRQSALIAKEIGPFPRFEENRDAMDQVVLKHFGEAIRLCGRIAEGDYGEAPLSYTISFDACNKIWEDAYESGCKYGYRNSQVTVIAPTGTIAFVMDAETGGIEPYAGLTVFKKLAGGGMIQLPSKLMSRGLKTLGYSDEQIGDVEKYIDENKTILGCNIIRDEHLKVFETAMYQPALPPTAHLKMMAAVQPFLSGGISKTVNMPKESTVEDIYDCYVEAWKLGLKAVAIYRDGSKATQPINQQKKKEEGKTLMEVFNEEEYGKFPQFDGCIIVKDAPDTSKPDLSGFSMQQEFRRKLPDRRESITHKFDIAGHEGYLTVGKYEDGSPGELFVIMSKEGSTVGGLTGAFATLVSLCLQYGVPLEKMIEKFSYTNFEPSGFTKCPEIGHAKSIVDYIFRWLELEFIKGSAGAVEPVYEITKRTGMPVDVEKCSCGGALVRIGTCQTCSQCGTTTGCG